MAEARCHLLYRQALYASKESAQLESEIKRLREKEAMRECTFQPKLFAQRRAISPRAPQPRNFEHAVARMRRANRQREVQQEARWHVPAGENYERLRRLGPQPFSCAYVDRVVSQRGPPLYYVDVDVGRGRTGRIGVHQGDDLRAKARSFARIFQLGREAAVRLEEMLHEAYEERLRTVDAEGHFEEQQEMEDMEEDVFYHGSPQAPGGADLPTAEYTKVPGGGHQQRREAWTDEVEIGSHAGSAPGEGGSPKQAASPKVAATTPDDRKSLSRDSSLAASPDMPAEPTSRRIEGAVL